MSMLRSLSISLASLHAYFVVGMLIWGCLTWTANWTKMMNFLEYALKQKCEQLKMWFLLLILFLFHWLQRFFHRVRYEIFIFFAHFSSNQLDTTRFWRQRKTQKERSRKKSVCEMRKLKYYDNVIILDAAAASESDTQRHRMWGENEGKEIELDSNELNILCIKIQTQCYTSHIMFEKMLFFFRIFCATEMET